MSKKKEVGDFVERKINYIHVRAKSGTENAILADLRRGIGHEPGELFQLFGITLQDMPESLLSRDGIPTEGEWACYLALTLYALHQQGYDIKHRSMHQKGERSIGHAMSRLASSYEDANAEQRCLQRLQMLATAIDMKEVSHHLRSIIQLLRSKGIELDYKRLAEDLFGLQFPEGRNRVCLKWGQDFYWKDYKKET